MSYKLSNLIFTPLPSIHMDFYSRRVVKCYFVNCPIDLGSTPSECQVFYLFRCVHSSVQPLRSVGRSHFDNGRHNLTTLIKKSTYINESCYIIYIYIYIYKTLNEIAKGNFKNTLIQQNMYNVQNFRPHLQSSSVERRHVYIYIYIYKSTTQSHI